MRARRPAAKPAFVSASHARRTRRIGQFGRIGWFVLLWTISVAALTAIALPLRWLLKST
ncbi:DUF2474 family protein [Methylorubrum thiocyanatum]|uniref:DUF2474 family protein n=1 Tax=Methylorubrum thiocyanatum TaxID=47958 RepID=UPI0035C7BF3A